MFWYLDKNSIVTFYHRVLIQIPELCPNIPGMVMLLPGHFGTESVTLLKHWLGLSLFCNVSPIGQLTICFSKLLSGFSNWFDLVYSWDSFESQSCWELATVEVTFIFYFPPPPPELFSKGDLMYRAFFITTFLTAKTSASEINGCFVLIALHMLSHDLFLPLMPYHKHF